MDLDTVAKVERAFLRLVGTTADDAALVENSEAVGEVVALYLTRGIRNAQRWMLKQGYSGWRKRSAALSWSGSDDADGGRYTALPADFLRAYGDSRMSALLEPSGDRWGREIRADEDHLRGNLYYVRGEQLWLARQAQPPGALYMDYHYKHPAWAGGVTIDFPMDVRSLAVAEAADAAKQEEWLPGGMEQEAKIMRALMRAREEARDYCRQTKQPRTLRKAPRFGTRW
jgi:hypothetical protein